MPSQTPPILLLPGLDGTGDLFRPFLQVLPSTHPTHILRYPTDHPLSINAQVDLLHAQLPDTNPVILIAESFSGPIALRYAAAHPANIHAIVLCASFIASPVPRCLRCLAHPTLFRLPLPHFVIRTMLLDSTAPSSLVHDVARAIRRVSPAVLAHRLHHVLTGDCADALRACSAPILYLQADHDRLVRPASLQRILSIRPEIRVKTLHAPHLLLQSAPSAAWQEINRFLSQM